MSDAISVKIILLRQRKLEENQLSDWQAMELLEQGCLEQLLGLGFLWAIDVHFRFDYRHEPRCKDSGSDFELLVYYL